MEPVEVRMLGQFSLTWGGRTISDTAGRGKKVWSLLAYLITRRDQPVSRQKLVELLWGDETDSSDPENVLRITLHRARGMLEQLAPEEGRSFIAFQDGGYQWIAPTNVDADRFDSLTRGRAPNREQLLKDLMEAMELYQGAFLPRQSEEGWVVPIAAHYRGRFLSGAQDAVALLIAENRQGEALSLCRRAIDEDPYHEFFYQALMQLLAMEGDRRSAMAAYEALSHRLHDDFGILPDEKTRSIYRKIAYAPGETALPMDTVMDDLHEEAPLPGALQCDYDSFRTLCYCESRSIERTGREDQILLINVAATAERPLTRQTLDTVMENLAKQIQNGLRRGDSFCRCSVSQYIILLRDASLENGQMVCGRILSGFRAAYPNARVRLLSRVQPLGRQLPEM